MNRNDKILSIENKNLLDRHLKETVYLIQINNIFGITSSIKHPDSIINVCVTEKCHQENTFGKKLLS